MNFMFLNEAFADTLPIAATEAAVSWNHLYDFLIWISIFSFVLVVGAMTYFAVRYRKKEGRKPEYITGSHFLEAIWIGVPTILLLIIFAWGYEVYREMRQAPTDAYEIKVIGKQWLWTFMYDNGTTTVNELFVPVNKPVKLVMTSQDVLHGFFIPNFRVKQDVVPGMYSSVWFHATVPGKHQVFCTEYCGTSHSGMLAQVIALEDKQWNDWLRGKKILADSIPVAGSQLTTQGSPATEAEAQAARNAVASGESSAPQLKQLSLAEQGRIVFEKKACTQCHSMAGDSRVGPTLKGLFGSKVALADGSEVTADENYIRESIEQPQAKLVKGYGPLMPTFKGIINENEMNALISYIKSVK